MIELELPPDEKIKVELNLLIFESKSSGFYISKAILPLIAKTVCYLDLA